MIRHIKWLNDVSYTSDITSRSEIAIIEMLQILLYLPVPISLYKIFIAFFQASVRVK